MRKNYIIKSSKKRNSCKLIWYYFQKLGGGFTRAGAFIGIFMVDVPEKFSKDIISMDISVKNKF